MKRTLALLALVVIAAAVMGARGQTRIQMTDRYVNEFTVTDTATTIGFNRIATGSVRSTDSTQTVGFVDIYNSSTDVICSIDVYTRTAPNDTVFRAYVPAGVSRSFDGFRITHFDVLSDPTGTLYFAGRN